VSIEKRAKGKKVTVISNVQGNAAALSTTLGRVLGVGGTVHAKGPLQAEVEVQGEQVERVSKVLLQLNCVRGLLASKDTAAHVVEKDPAHDGLFDGSGPSEGRKPRHAALGVARAAAELPPDNAPCRQWHGYWPYCRGTCSISSGPDEIVGASKSLGMRQRQSVLLWGLWDDDSAGMFTPAQPQRAAAWQSASSSSMVGLDDGLRRLGMLAQIGAALEEWVQRREELTAQATLRRTAAKPSLCAPGHMGQEGSFECPECGMSFGTKQTLKKHSLQHRRDREVATTTVSAAPVRDWRGAPLSLESNEWGWESRGAAALVSQDWAWSDDDVANKDQMLAPAAVSLAAFINVGARGPKQRKSERARAQPMAPCPVCGKQLPITEMDFHVDVCLLTGSEQVEIAVPSWVDPSASGRHLGTVVADDPLDGSVPVDLLEIFLELDLPPAAASHFWDRYDALVLGESKGSREAFMAALEDALSLQQEGVGDSASSLALGTSAAPLDHREGSLLACRSGDDSELRSEVEDNEPVMDIATRAALAAIIAARVPLASATAGTSSGLMQQLVRAAASTGRGNDPGAGCESPTSQGVLGHQASSGSRWPRSTARVAGSVGAHLEGPNLQSQGAPSSSSGRSAKGKSGKAPPPPPPKSLSITSFAPPMSYAEAADGSASQARAIAAWLQTSLIAFLGNEDAEGVAAGVEVVLANAGSDPDAAENAWELLCAELGETHGEAAAALLAEFDERLTKKWPSGLAKVCGRGRS